MFNIICLIWLLCRLRLSPIRYYYTLQHEGVCEPISLVSYYMYTVHRWFTKRIGEYTLNITGLLYVFVMYVNGLL